MKRILVVAEKDSKDLTAFHRAIALSANKEMAIDLVGFVHAAGVDSSELLTENEKKKVRQRLIDEKTAWMKDKIQSLELENITLDWGVLWEKSVHRWTIERCKQKPYDMVIKTGNRTESMTYTPTDWHLIRECAAPVMIISSKKWKTKSSILATLDLGSENNSKIKLNKQVIEHAQMLAATTKQSISYFYCINIPRIIDDLEILDEAKLSRKAKEKAFASLEKYYKKYKLTPEDIIISRGSIDKAISKAAKKQAADLVILGTLGRKGIKGKLIGNTAESVLHGLNTDVLTIKN